MKTLKFDREHIESLNDLEFINEGTPQEQLKSIELTITDKLLETILHYKELMKRCKIINLDFRFDPDLISFEWMPCADFDDDDVDDLRMTITEYGYVGVLFQLGDLTFRANWIDEDFEIY